MEDSLPFVNQYYTTGGDIDGDGRPEFFVGAVTNGYYLTMYEADGDNHYMPKLLIHFLVGDLYPNNFCADIDGDGRVELVTMVARNLFVFKSNGDNNYYVSYLKREDRKDALSFYDFNHYGKLDFLISKSVVQKGLRLYADISLSQSILDVKERPDYAKPDDYKLRTYPNPFNPVVTIEFQLPKSEMTSITVFDNAGRVVARLLEKMWKPAGRHIIAWDANNFASGVYLINVQTPNVSITQKTILVR